MTIGVIFDVDGVLIDSHEPHLESWRQLSRERGVSISDEVFTASFGRTSRETVESLFGVRDAEIVRQCDDRKEVIYRELIRDGVPEMPGAKAAVRRLYDAGFKLALGSSAPPENVQLVRDGLQLDGMLSAVVTGTDVQRGKPDPQVFQLAAERLGLDVSQCVVIEDAPTGVEAGHRAGMKVVGLVHAYDPSRVAAAERKIEHLDELTPELIRTIV